MRKKGMLVFADVTWFIIFVLVALLFYFVLFKPLGGEMNNKIEPTHLETDADFIAATLPRMHVNAGTDNSRRAYNDQPFSKLLGSVLEEYRTDDGNYQRTQAFTDYKSFIETIVFPDALLSDVRTLEKRKGHTAIVAYAVALFDGSDYMEGSCVFRSVHQNDLNLCSLIDDFSSTDPVTGVPQPLLASQSASDSQDGGQFIGVGVSHIPTEAGVITLEVIVQYEIG